MHSFVYPECFSVMMDGSFFEGDGLCAGCCMLQFKRYKTTSVAYPVRLCDWMKRLGPISLALIRRLTNHYGVH